jgi:hypothetical protein
LSTSSWLSHSALAFLLIAGLVNVAHASDGVEICNEGTVPIGVAYLDDRRAMANTMNFWTASGWDWVDGNRCKTVWWQTGLVHLVFAVRTPRGEFGVITRPFKVRPLPILNRRSSLCVTEANFNESGSMNSPMTYLPPCRGKFKEVPTSVSLMLGGERDKVTLNVTATATDYQHLVVSFADQATQQKLRFTGYVDKLARGYYAGFWVTFLKDEAGAIALLNRYRASGFPVAATTALGNPDALSVYLGPFPDRAALESAKQRLKTIPTLPQWAFDVDFSK